MAAVDFLMSLQGDAADAKYSRVLNAMACETVLNRRYLRRPRLLAIGEKRLVLVLSMMNSYTHYTLLKLKSL